MKKTKLKTHKTRYIAYVAASIDGRISLSKNKSPDWTSKEDWKFFQNGLSKADAVVAGRNTYISAKSSLEKRNAYILTSRVRSITEKNNIQFINPKTTDLKSLFKKYKIVAIVGGSRVYQSMLSLGLLDEIYVTIEPLIFGRGKEMFIGGKKTARLALISLGKLNKSGTILAHYKVIHPI